MTDERRERYAAAIWEAYERSGGSVLDVAPDAAMAVADEELKIAVLSGSVIQAQQITRLQEETARLRAELAEANREIDTLGDMFREHG